MEPKQVRDDAGAQETIHETEARRVPEELMRQLHAANGRADELRQRLEAALGDTEMGQGQRAAQVGEDLRAAEAAIEEINGRIRDASPPEARGEA